MSTILLDFKDISLDRWRNVNYYNGTRTSLFSAVQQGSEEKVKLLIEKGAEVSHIDHDGNTALTIALKKKMKVWPTFWLGELIKPHSLMKELQKIIK